jgi:hypothetical protein
MDILAWKLINDFREDVFYKRKSRIIAGAKNIADGPETAGQNGNRVAGIGILQIAGQGRYGMGGHFNLGHNRNITACRIGDDFSDILLRIVSAIDCFFTRLLRFTVVPVILFTIDPPCADFSERWRFLDFNAPTLVVRQMPVKVIEFVGRPDSRGIS